MRLLFVSVLFLPSLVVAQDPPPRAGAGAGQAARPDYVKGAFGLDLTTQYFFRGIQQENQGIIAQPWLWLGWDIYEGQDTVRDVDVKFGLWNSLHDGPTGGAGGPWYESDFFIQTDVAVSEQWKFDARYTAYSSPNGSFATIQELSFGARFDDSKEPLIGGIEGGLRPHVLIAFELDNQRDLGNDEGIYLELGVEPTFKLTQDEQFPLTLAVPVTLGLGLADYYEEVGGGDNELFGYLDVGGELSTPIKFFPERMGAWNAYLGLHWLLLGDNLEDRNQGDTTELILSFGIDTTF